MGVSVGTKKVASSAGRAPVTDINDPKQLEGLAKRLLAFARRYARVMTWWLNRSDGLAKGNTIEDIVRTAMVSLFGELDPDPNTTTGKRRWDPKKYPEPFVYLMLVVKTELRNLAVSSENRLSDRDVDDDALTTDKTAEALLVEAEDAAEHDRRVQRLYSLLIDEIADDEQVQTLHDHMIDGTYKPQLLADRLSMSVKDINNLKRRMSNAAKRALARLDKELNS
jgi:hypothetical protein